MAATFRNTFIMFALIGLFAFAMISFIVTFQRDNGVSTTILSNEIINRTYSGLESNLSSFRDVAQGQRENFEAEVPERGFGSLIIFSIVSVGQKFTSLLVGVYNILIVLPAATLGVPKVVISVITSILIISLIILAWSVYRMGR